MFPKMGNVLPTGSKCDAAGLTYAEAVSEALRAELGGSNRSVKTVIGWTTANERTVKNWMAGTSGPRGDHLVDIIRHSDTVFRAVLGLAGREGAAAIVDLALLRRRLVEMEADLGRLIESSASSRP